MSSPVSVVAPPPPRLLDRVRLACRLRHYSVRTEDAYIHWIKRYIFFHDKRHPQELAAADINRFLTHLAVVGRVSASTQNQAFAALLFLYQKVLEVDPGRSVGSLVRPMVWLLVVVAVSALTAGILGWLLAQSGAVFLVGPIARELPTDRHVPFLADLWAHSASYLVGLVGGIVLMVLVWRSRGRAAVT